MTENDDQILEGLKEAYLNPEVPEPGGPFRANVMRKIRMEEIEKESLFFSKDASPLVYRFATICAVCAIAVSPYLFQDESDGPFLFDSSFEAGDINLF